MSDRKSDKQQDAVRRATEKIDKKIERLKEHKQTIQNKQETIENTLGVNADVSYKLEGPSDHVRNSYRLVVDITCNRVPPEIQDMAKSNTRGNIDVMDDKIQVWLSYTIEEL